MSLMSINLKINKETNRDNNGKHIYHFDNKYYIIIKTKKKKSLRSRTLIL